MVDLKLRLPEGFLEEEERCGYRVSAQMKQLWAVQLDLLAQLQQVCQRHGLTYYADSGTLIGAVRHGGYIPWDDDIDIVMKREDYDRLLALGPEEFREPYFLQSAYSDGFTRGFARLRNTRTTALTRFDFGKDYDHGIFIDIFPLDELPDGGLRRALWLLRVKVTSRLMVMGVFYEPERLKNPVEKAACRALRCCFAKDGRLLRYFRRYEKLCAKYNGRGGRGISYVAYSHGKRKHLWERASFERSHETPFEFTHINIPDGYDARLRTEYGDYMTIRRTPTVHGDMVFDAGLPYEEYEKTHDPEWIRKALGLDERA
ncbi:MAG: LicD family protein [Oscillospiraceae bacterium]|nr:LicD family protein [Oscillospiraceae bacterium]